MDLRFRA